MANKRETLEEASGSDNYSEPGDEANLSQYEDEDYQEAVDQEDEFELEYRERRKAYDKLEDIK